VKKKILIVDDRINTLKVTAAILEDEGFEVFTADSGAKALAIVDDRSDIDAVLSDLKMPGMDGLELYTALQTRDNPPPFIIITAHGTVKSAVAALKEGVANYLIKPLDYDELVIVLSKAIQETELKQELLSLKQRIPREESSYHGILGTSTKMKRIFEMVQTVGPTDVSVMIYGETGTGKELLARALHLESQRRSNPLVCINSAALSESLLEAELFGYVKGAFTGAVSDRKGRLEAAHGGTLFLDEIGHMSMGLQTKLLRFLQEMSFEPVGGTRTKRVDVRIITATNFDLQEKIKAGAFLGDLLYRLEVIPIHVPALRERSEDICLLVDYFIRRYGARFQKEVRGISTQALNLLMNYHWPGNVRELKNSIARAVILTSGSRLEIEDLPDKILDSQGNRRPASGEGLIARLPARGVTLKAMEKELIAKTLGQCRGNKSRAAASLGISRKTLYEKIERYGIDVGPR
jgi:DNA-binding NtrC family response regulator